MTVRREVDMMVCASCGEEKAWNDGFPQRIYARCWACAWKAHNREAHPPSWSERRTAVRKARLAAGRLALAELRAARNGAPPPDRGDR